MNRMLLSLGIAAIVLSLLLVAASVVVGNSMLRTVAAIYILMAVATLCFREVRRRVYRIRKRRISRR